MEHKKIYIVLASVLAFACVVVTAVLVSVNRRNYIPYSAVEDMVELLSDANIDISPSIISTKHQKGNVYICGSDEYDSTVVRLLSDGDIRSVYGTPDGEIIVLDDGSLFEFGGNFSFRYSADGKKKELPDVRTLEDISGGMNDRERQKLEKTVTGFLEKGDKEFKLSGQISVRIVVEKICQYNGKTYVVCSRTIDGAEITDNTVVCTYEDGNVTDVEGVWCFFTEGKSYSAQLSDILSILFNIRKEITATPNDRAKIISVGMCYSLYYYGNGNKFCVIPCWQIKTESNGEFIFNALDSTLYTKR